MNDVLLTPIRLNELEILIQNSVQKAIAIVQNKEKSSVRDSEDNFLTVQETAKFLSLSVATIYSKCSRGELTYFKQGKRLYFSQKGLSEYLKQGRVKSNDELQAEAALYTLKKKGGRV